MSISNRPCVFPVAALLFILTGCAQDDASGGEPWGITETHGEQDTVSEPPSTVVEEDKGNEDRVLPPPEMPTTDDNEPEPDLEPDLSDEVGPFVHLLGHTCATNRDERVVCWDPAVRELVGALGVNELGLRPRKLVIHDKTVCVLGESQRLWCGSLTNPSWGEELSAALKDKPVADVLARVDSSRGVLVAIDDTVGVFYIDGVPEIVLSPRSDDGDPLTMFADTTGVDYGVAAWGLTRRGRAVTLSVGGKAPLPEDRTFVRLAQQHVSRLCGVTDGGEVVCNDQAYAGNSRPYTITLPEDARASDIWFQGEEMRILSEDGQLYVQRGDDEPSLLPSEHSIRIMQYQPGEPDCALDNRGEIHCHGAPSSYEWLLEEQAMTEAKPVEVTTDATFSQLATSSESACGVTIEGDVICWGNTPGLDDALHHTPRVVRGWEEIEAITSGPRSYCVRSKDRDWYCNTPGRLGQEDHTGNAQQDHLLPVNLPEGVILEEVHISLGFVGGRDASGAVYWWGHEHERAPGVVEKLSGWRWSLMVATDIALCGVTSPAAIAGSGATHCVVPSNGASAQILFPEGFGTPVEFAAVLNTTVSSPPLRAPMCARDERGAVACWNFYHNATPTQLDTIEAYLQHDGAIPARGIYFQGTANISSSSRPCLMLEDGTTRCGSREVETFADHITESSAEAHFSCGLDADGVAYCWGDDERKGVLGRGLPLAFPSWELASVWRELALRAEGSTSLEQ